MGVGVREKKACDYEIVCCQQKMFASFVLNILFWLEKAEKKNADSHILFCIVQYKYVKEREKMKRSQKERNSVRIKNDNILKR